jgi:hypothetical protein
MNDRVVTFGWRTAAALVLLVAAGCGSGRYPVTGRVTYEDGTPLTEGNVVGYLSGAETGVTVQGSVKGDGTFTWGTDRPGEGVKPGRYRVAVIPRGLGDAEIASGKLPAVDAKFSNPDKSGIEIEVKDGRNELNITVTRPVRKAR